MVLKRAALVRELLVRCVNPARRYALGRATPKRRATQRG